MKTKAYTLFLVAVVAIGAFFAGTWAITSSAQEDLMVAPIELGDTQTQQSDQLRRGDSRPARPEPADQDPNGAQQPQSPVRLMHCLTNATAELTGLDGEVVKQLRHDGSSLHTIAENHGVSDQAVIDNAMARIEHYLDKAIAEGRFPAELKQAE